MGWSDRGKRVVQAAAPADCAPSDPPSGQGVVGPAVPQCDKPDAANLHVRICGSLGGAVPLGDPATRDEAQEGERHGICVFRWERRRADWRFRKSGRVSQRYLLGLLCCFL
jgi:hypothetical protein